jgi:transposase
VFGISGWAILEMIAKGETDREKLLSAARGALRKKREQLREALEGRLVAGHRLLLRQALEQARLLETQVEEINQTLSAAMRDHAAALARLCRIPGLQLYAAEELLAEIGPGAAAFPSAGQFASWVGLCPGSHGRPRGIATSGACLPESPSPPHSVERCSCQLSAVSLNRLDATGL